MNSNSSVLSHASPSTSVNLLKRVVEGDQEAWSRFVDVYGPIIYRGCRRSNLSADDAADVVQNVLMRVLKSIGTLSRDQPGQGLRVWLRTVANNVVNDHFRKLGKEKDALGGRAFAAILDELLCPLTNASDSEMEPPVTVRTLHEKLAKFRKDYQDKTWQAFWRTVAGHEATADVANDLGMTPQNVRQARHKILKRLRAELPEIL